MFHEIRKKNRQIGEEEAKKILSKGEYGILGTIGQNQYPYCVPVNYIYYKDFIYIHCSKKGHKLDNIQNSNKISFSVVTYEEIDEQQVSTDYESVVIFGKATILEEEKKEEIFTEILNRLTPNFIDKNNYIQKHGPAAEIIKIQIEHITGKARYDKKLRNQTT